LQLDRSGAEELVERESDTITPEPSPWWRMTTGLLRSPATSSKKAPSSSTPGDRSTVIAGPALTTMVTWRDGSPWCTPPADPP
jgi:hypothetical protein